MSIAFVNNVEPVYQQKLEAV